mmetsp:Transcript_75/g.102  ORF Transcript_75/g.102 Transcript_75/m.102 type:complete len:88 (+) Transcript_75:1037-1300(+)
MVEFIKESFPSSSFSEDEDIVSVIIDARMCDGGLNRRWCVIIPVCGLIKLCPLMLEMTEKQFVWRVNEEVRIATATAYRPMIEFIYS